MKRLLAVAAMAGALTCVSLALATPADAHPLGNFSVNHFHGLTLRADRVEDHAVLDQAEIPTLQARSGIDRDGNGTVDDTERAAAATDLCHALASGAVVKVNGKAIAWTVGRADLSYHPGAASLDTSRLECDLTAPADLRRTSTVTLDDGYRADRVGWHEITAVGDGVRIDSPARQASVSDELRTYPQDLLTSPLGERSIKLRTSPGSGAVGGGSALPTSGVIGRWLGALTTTFNNLVGRRELTVPLGLLAVGLALLLGAGHALLPGHGKTVMAAYIAGKRGTVRDAVTVGATVTVTHTAGVLVLGAVLTVVAGLAGETVLGWLGVGSGLIIAGVGVTLLVSAFAARRHHHHAPDHSHSHDHSHGHDHGHHHHHHDEPLSRRGLLGMGIAGGLVPSPSALVVLLGAIALGRTWFGILLVVAYGAGMAAVLTAAGLLLVKVRDRLAPAITGRFGRVRAALPLFTAGLVLVVGLGLAIRGALPLIGGPL